MTKRRSLVIIAVGVLGLVEPASSRPPDPPKGGAPPKSDEERAAARMQGYWRLDVDAWFDAIKASKETRRYQRAIFETHRFHFRPTEYSKGEFRRAGDPSSFRPKGSPIPYRVVNTYGPNKLHVAFGTREEYRWVIFGDGKMTIRADRARNTLPLVAYDRAATPRPKKGPPLSSLFPRGGVAVPKPFGPITLGETRADTLRGPRASLLSKTGLVWRSRDDIVLHADTTSGGAAASGPFSGWRKDRINRLRVRVPTREEAREALTQAWGRPVSAPEPTGVTIGGKRPTAQYWFDRRLRLRAVLTSETAAHHYVTIDRYSGLLDVLAPQQATTDLASRGPLLGATVETLRKSFALDWVQDRIFLPPMGLSNDAIAVIPRATKGVVRAYTIQLRYPGHVARRAIIAALRKKYPTAPQLVGAGPIVLRKAAPRVTFRETTHEHVGIITLEVAGR